MCYDLAHQIRCAKHTFSGRCDITPMVCCSFGGHSTPQFLQCSTISYVQDPVHVAVKLKARLIKTSIVLPLGNYAAGVHHLRMVHKTFNKDEHGLREWDINHKDKQNYEAVIRITSNSVFSLLGSAPDAKGTLAFLSTLKCVTDSYLDRSLTPLERIHKAWYGVFFMRFRRQ